MSTKNLFNYVTPRSFSFWRKVCEDEDCLLLLTLGAAILMVLMAAILSDTNTELTTGQTILVGVGTVVEIVCAIFFCWGIVQLLRQKND